MKINGHIEIRDAETDTVIAECSNTFTDTGRQHVCNWLLHNNYSDDVDGDGIHNNQGGRSVSDMRILPYTAITPHQVGTSADSANPEYSLYPHNTNYSNSLRMRDGNQFWEDYPYSYNDEIGTVFYEFDKPYDLQSVMIWARQTDSWDRQYLIEISTSPDAFADAQANGTWTRQHIDEFETYWDDTWSNRNRCIPYRFDFRDHPYRIVENVRCVRIRTCYLDWTTTWASVYGIWFLEAIPYPSTPSVMSFGTGATPTNPSDTELETEVYRKFITKHKDTGNDFQIKYNTRLYEDECNNTQIKEVGLHFNPKAGDYIGLDHGADICTGMFARGIFSSPWTKSDGQIVDVNYTLTITD